MLKPQPILFHMPTHIKTRIVGFNDTHTKIALRQCCKEFKSLVDETTMNYGSLDFNWNCDEEQIRVSLSLAYGSEDELLYDGSDSQFIEKSIDKLLKIFRNPKTSLWNFEIRLQNCYENEEQYSLHKNRILGRMNQVLSSLGHQISVSNLDMDCENPEDVLQILPFFRPGVLRKIHLTPSVPLRVAEQPDYNMIGDMDFSGIAETEQWKQLKSVYLFSLNMILPPEKTFPIPEMIYCLPRIELEDVRYTVHNMLQNDHWIYRDMRSSGHFDYVAVLQYMSQFEELESRNPEKRVYRVRQDEKEFSVEIGQDGSISFIKPCWYRKCSRTTIGSIGK